MAKNDEGAETTIVDVSPTDSTSGSGTSEVLDTNGSEVGTQDTRDANAGKDGGSGKEREGFIPRERFDQVNTELGRLRQNEPLLQEVLRDYGSVENYRQQQQALRDRAAKADESEVRREIDKRVQADIDAGRIAYDAADDWRDALLAKAELNTLKPKIEQTRAQQEAERKNAAFVSERGTELEELKKKYPDADEAAAGYAAFNPRLTKAEREEAVKKSHDRVQELLVKANAKREAVAAKPAVERGGSGGVVKTTTLPKAGTPEAAKYIQDLKDKAWNAKYG